MERAAPAIGAVGTATGLMLGHCPASSTVTRESTVTVLASKNT